MMDYPFQIKILITIIFVCFNSPLVKSPKHGKMSNLEIIKQISKSFKASLTFHPSFKSMSDPVKALKSMNNNNYN